LIHECLILSVPQSAVAEISPSALLNFIFHGRHTHSTALQYSSSAPSLIQAVPFHLAPPHRTSAVCLCCWRVCVAVL